MTSGLGTACTQCWLRTEVRPTGHIVQFTQVCYINALIRFVTVASAPHCT